jgi:hypothetical protein
MFFDVDANGEECFLSDKDNDYNTLVLHITRSFILVLK